MSCTALQPRRGRGPRVGLDRKRRAAALRGLCALAGTRGRAARRKAAAPDAAVIKEHGKVAAPRERRALTDRHRLRAEEPAARRASLVARCAERERREAAGPAGHRHPRLLLRRLAALDRAQERPAVGQRHALVSHSRSFFASFLGYSMR